MCAENLDFKLSAAQKLKSWDSFTINVSSLSKLVAIKMWMYVFPSEMCCLSRTRAWHLGDTILLIRMPFLGMTLLLSPPVCTHCNSKGLQWPCHRLEDQWAAEDSKLLVIQEKMTMNKMQCSFSLLSVLFQIRFGVFFLCAGKALFFFLSPPTPTPLLLAYLFLSFFFFLFWSNTHRSSWSSPRPGCRWTS